jgi:protein-S-isoprenylcysteine O-methyltransferase Ste14
MGIVFNFWPTLVFATVIICWFAFAGAFILRKKPPSPPDQKREPGSLFGVALQGLSYALVWAIHRQSFTLIIDGSPPARKIALAGGMLAMAVAIGSVYLVMASIKTLGKEWSLTARVVEGHKLATTGPYARVRHPIYTGMLGMLLATGLAISVWQVLVIALVVFFVGTIIRIRSEEKLLRETFGETFDDYKQRVSAILPGIY